MHSQSTSTRPGIPLAGSAGAVIARGALVRRHNVSQRTLDPRSPVPVGNGEFAVTIDLPTAWTWDASLSG